VEGGGGRELVGTEGEMRSPEADAERKAKTVLRAPHAALSAPLKRDFNRVMTCGSWHATACLSCYN
jgi:hypothetical protein